MCSSTLPGGSILQVQIKMWSENHGIAKQAEKNVQTGGGGGERLIELTLEWCAHVKQFSWAPEYSEHLFERGQVISCSSD